MTKIEIISGFLGAGKTTLIKKLIEEFFKGEKLVLIENEFGEIGIDGGFLKDAGIQINEMNSGCICCSLVGDFADALKKVIEEYNPDRIIIEPSGVGKLSDVIKAIEDVKEDIDIEVNSATTVVDVLKCKMYIKNFGEFFNDQVSNAGTIVLSRTSNVAETKLIEAMNLLRELNEHSTIITTPWDQITGDVIFEAMEHSNTLQTMLKKAEQEAHSHGHHDFHDHEHNHEHGEDCKCGCHEEHDHHGHHDCHDHEHHHEHGEDCGCGCHEEHDHHGHHDFHDHEHHHKHGEDCGCGCHDHHGHHHADDIFTSWGRETAIKFGYDEMTNILEELAYESDKFGIVLRAKGIVPSDDNEWIYFDLVPGEYEIRKGDPDYTGKLCVIGSNLNEDAIEKLFLNTKA